MSIAFMVICAHDLIMILDNSVKAIHLRRGWIFMHENCDTCSTDYDFAPDNAQLIMFLNYMKATHVAAKCPNGHIETIYITAESFLHILQECHLPVAFGWDPTPERRASCDAIFAGMEDIVDAEIVPPKTVEVDVPHYMLRDLYDQLRDYEGSN